MIRRLLNVVHFQVHKNIDQESDMLHNLSTLTEKSVLFFPEVKIYYHDHDHVQNRSGATPIHFCHL